MKIGSVRAFHDWIEAGFWLMSGITSTKNYWIPRSWRRLAQTNLTVPSHTLVKGDLIEGLTTLCRWLFTKYLIRCGVLLWYWQIYDFVIREKVMEWLLWYQGVFSCFLFFSFSKVQAGEAPKEVRSNATIFNLFSRTIIDVNTGLILFHSSMIT